jgi:hypothetical protein
MKLESSVTEVKLIESVNFNEVCCSIIATVHNKVTGKTYLAKTWIPKYEELYTLSLEEDDLADYLEYLDPSWEEHQMAPILL